MKRRTSVLVSICMALAVFAAPGCGGGGGGETPPPSDLAPPDQSAIDWLTISSPAFEHGQPIPPKYSRKGENVSPPLEWSNPPEGTRSLALICDDPDAPGGTWVHWVIFNIPARTRSMPEGTAREAELSFGIRNGKNSWGDLGYDGPQPPGGTHRYYFKLYALDTELDLAAGADKGALLEAMTGHVLAQGELMGTYSK